MTLTACVRSWGPDVYNWASNATPAVGMRLNEAFSAFAAAVNATPANATLQLSVLRNHLSATGSVSFGFVWRLGHPVTPLVLSFHNTSLAQGFSSSDSSAQLRLGLESAWIDDTSNGGYGGFSATLLNAAYGLSHYGPAGSPAVAGLEGALVVIFDVTPGQEFFSATILRPGEDTYSANVSILLFRSPATSGWNVWFQRARAYIGLFGISHRWTWRGDAPEMALPLSVPSGSQQISSPCWWFQLPAPSGPLPYNTTRIRVQVPPLFWVGDNQHTEPRRLGRFSDPAGGGTFYQLGAATGFADDLWVRLPSTPAPAVLSGWSSVGSLAWRTFTDRLAVMQHPQLEPALVGGSSAPDMAIDWSSCSAGLPGLQQHPLFALQLGGGGGVGGGGSGRPATGVLWPRRA
jgi:hypothetical protein